MSVLIESNIDGLYRIQERQEAQRKIDEENQRKQALEDRKKQQKMSTENMRENIRKHRVSKKSSSAENGDTEDVHLIASPIIPTLFGEVSNEGIRYFASCMNSNNKTGL